MKRVESKADHLYKLAGSLALQVGPTNAHRITGLSEKVCRYWRQKLVDPAFHSGTRGGARHLKFDDSTQLVVDCLLWNELKREPQKILHEFADFLQGFGYNVDDEYVHHHGV